MILEGSQQDNSESDDKNSHYLHPSLLSATAKPVGAYKEFFRFNSKIWLLFETPLGYSLRVKVN